LSMAGQSTHKFGPPDPPSDRWTPYVGQFRVTQSPPQGSQAMPDMAIQSVHSTKLSSPITDRPTTQVSLVQKAGINIAGHLSTRSQKGYTSVSLFAY
jgi:hypothetical protein